MDSLFFAAFSYLCVRRLQLTLSEKEPCLSIESARVLLVIDIGSSSIRCNAFAVSQSTSIATAGGVALSPEESHLAKTLLSCGVKLDYAIISGSEKPIDIDFVVNLIHQACHQCIQRVCQKVAHPDILAIGFSSLCMNIIGVDVNGRVITPFFTYEALANTRSRCRHRDFAARG